MTAAAKNLSSVTLELGGKSPTIVDHTANIRESAERIVWGKFLNVGQTCIAPDYVLAHEKIYNKLAEELRSYIHKHYPNPQSDESYGRIISRDHFERLKKLSPEINDDLIDNFFPPTVMENVGEDDPVMKEEIFGPLLPIIKYKDTKEAVDFINRNDRPLALYIYSRNRKNIKYILDNTRSGGVCLNHNNIHYSNHYLPFGGINESGIGRSKGIHGFKDFSNARAIVKQTFLWSPLKLFYPPYSQRTKKLVKLVMKWL